MPVWGFTLSMFVALMWAVSPVLMREAMKRCTPNEVPAVRSISFILTMIILMTVTQPGKLPHLTPKLFAALLGSTALSSLLGDLLYVFAIQKIGASIAVSISSVYPLITAVLSIFLLGEHVPPLVWAGTVCLVTGIVIIKIDAGGAGINNNFPGYLPLDREEIARRRKAMTQGIAFALGSALCSGLNIPVIKMLMVAAGWNPTESYFMRSVAFFIMAWTMREIQHRFAPASIVPIEKLPASTWAYLLGSGVVGIAVSGVLFAKCLMEFPVSVVTPVAASSPFMAVILSRLFLKERLTKIQNAGVALVLAGSICVSL
jgi:drug/metabolite transporter (DMT)-like permease